MSSPVPHAPGRARQVKAKVGFWLVSVPRLVDLTDSLAGLSATTFTNGVLTSFGCWPCFGHGPQKRKSLIDLTRWVWIAGVTMPTRQGIGPFHAVSFSVKP